MNQGNANNTEVVYTYNEDRNWPDSITHKASGTAFASYSLEYDGGANTVGNLTEVTELDSSVVSYEYDALYRLTEEVRTGTNPYTRTYGYDLANNVTTINGSTFATYDDGNKMATLSGGTVYHDSYGNLRSASATGVTFTALAASPYDPRNKLTTGTSGRSYRYHAEGIRGALKPNTSSAWVAYLHDGTNLIGEINSSGPIAAYTHGPDGIVSERLLTGTPKSLWYHYGPQGETRQLTNSSGTTTNTYRYNAYGNLLGSTGSDTNPFRYGGKFGYYTDTTISAILAQQRWYQPQLMRWTTRDPIYFDGGDNTYAYVMGNPVRWVDPDGLDVVVIVSGGTLENPAGHAAAAVSGFGVVSYGTPHKPGMSLKAYVLQQRHDRKVKLFRIKLSQEQDAEFLQAFTDIAYKNWSVSNNCAVAVSNGLKKVGAMPSNTMWPGVLEQTLRKLGSDYIEIPIGGNPNRAWFQDFKQ